MSATTKQTVNYRGWTAHRLANHEVELLVVPDLGAKIVSLKNMRTGREWLWRDPVRPMIRPTGADPTFADGDLSGFDECFPTIGPCRYPVPGPRFQTPLTDHGEVWFRPWRMEKQPGGITCVIDGDRLPYTFSRSVSLAPGGRIHLRYALINHADTPLEHAWSAHPLLAAQPGMRVDVPGHPTFHPEFGLGPRIHAPANAPPGTAPLPTYTWPHLRDTDATAHDLAPVIFPPVSIDKIVLDAPERITLVHELSSEWIRFEVDPGVIPFIGLCMNLGAWPADQPQAWIAIEPTMASTDRLDTAHARGHTATVPPHEYHRWRFDIILGDGSTSA